jgi:hypothetical protein
MVEIDSEFKRELSRLHEEREQLKMVGRKKESDPKPMSEANQRLLKAYNILRVNSIDIPLNWDVADESVQNN